MGTNRYRQGGLMRCCLVTLAKAYAPEDLETGDILVVETEGAKLPCQWCSSKMVFRDGAWEWDRSRAPIHGVAIPAEAELA